MSDEGTIIEISPVLVFLIIIIIVLSLALLVQIDAKDECIELLEVAMHG